VIATPRVHDFASWRSNARELLAAQTPPEAVTWLDAGERAGLLALESTPSEAPPRDSGTTRIPRELLQLLETCACHRSPAKWALMYRITWRAQHGERHVLALAADPEVRELRAMARAVEQDCHKMHAFVRFREVSDAADSVQYVAWFEPQHLILERVAQFFVDRFAGMHWTIVTPDGALQWDRSRLRSIDRSEAPQLPHGDDTELLWRTYYASIFNPARVNARATARHMPKRYWHNLPEAVDIASLSAAAPARADRMLATQPNDTDRWAHAVPVANVSADQSLPAAIARCTRCALWERATQAVCGAGPLPAAMMLVGEQPGDEEDLKGLPFVGPAGRLLDRALAAAGIDRQTVYVTNAVKHFKWEPRGKRRMHKTPAQAEVAACIDWLEQEIAQAQPRVIVALGATALSALLRRRESIAAARSAQLTHACGARIVATYHPAAILRAQPDMEAQMFAALCSDLRGASAALG
jgi:uracil-DNA glycosylase